jgi:hypothetical protein
MTLKANVLVSLRKRVNEAMHAVPWGRSSNGVFVRMSARSPKDAAMERPLSYQTRHRMAQLLTQAQHELERNAQTPPAPLLATSSTSSSSTSASIKKAAKAMPSIVSDDNAVATCFFQATVDVLAVHDGDEAIALLTNSERVFLDNQLIADEWDTVVATKDSKESKGKSGNKSSTSVASSSIDVASEDKASSGVSIVIREWQSMGLGCEWRGFVGPNNKLNGLSQYYSMLHFPSLTHHDTNASSGGQVHSAAVRSFFDRVITKCVPSNMAPYVVDFVVLPRQVPIAGAGAKGGDATTDLPPAEQRWRVLVGEMNPVNRLLVRYSSLP